MNTNRIFKWNVEKGHHTPHHVITLKSPWRKLPYILDKAREFEISVQKAYVRMSETTLFMNGNIQSYEKQLTQGISINERERAKDFYNNRLKLPKETNILLYNIPSLKYTTLEFICTDRIGLLCDLLDVLSSFPIEVRSAHVSTFFDCAHNIFYLTIDGKPLTENDITYIKNVFEYEVKCSSEPPSE